MINLIPKEEKKKLIRDFYYRLVVLVLVMLSFSMLIAFVAILPSYFLSSMKNNIIKAKLETQDNEPVPVPEERTLAVIKDLNNKLKLIENSGNGKFTITQKVINPVILKKISSIKINNISYENDPVRGKKISIQGTAPSREVLLLFRLALEDNVAFKQVDLPISNFVKGSNIEFYMSLIPS